MSVLPFTAELARLSPEEFVQILVDGLRAKAVFVGENFRFGYKKAGNRETVAHAWEAVWVRFAFCMKPVVYRGEVVSSTPFAAIWSRAIVARESPPRPRLLVEGPLSRAAESARSKRSRR